jgi:hypothetical protein
MLNVRIIPRVPFMNVCLICGNEHTRRSSYCGNTCAGKARKKLRPIKVCPACGNEHTRYGPYCGQLCANRSRTPEQRARANAGQFAYYAKLTLEQRKELTIKARAGGHASKQTLQKIWAEKLASIPWENLTSSYQRKRRLIAEGGGKCNGCGLSEWRELPIVLELEHKDGNHMNDSRENLEVLCPNCHSQTSTWRGRGSNAFAKKVSDEQLLIALDAHASPHQTKTIADALGSLGMNRGGWNGVRCKMLLMARNLKDKVIDS